MECPDCGAKFGYCRVYFSDLPLFLILRRPARCTRCMRRRHVAIWTRLLTDEEALPLELDWEPGKGIDYRLPRGEVAPPSPGHSAGEKSQRVART